MTLKQAFDRTLAGAFAPCWAFFLLFVLFLAWFFTILGMTRTVGPDPRTVTEGSKFYLVNGFSEEIKITSDDYFEIVTLGPKREMELWQSTYVPAADNVDGYYVLNLEVLGSERYKVVRAQVEFYTYDQATIDFSIDPNTWGSRWVLARWFGRVFLFFALIYAWAVLIEKSDTSAV